MIPPESSRFAPRAKKIAPVYRLEVTLCDVAPPIWRRFQVRGDITLYRLHGVLQAVMGWSNTHMYDFVIGKTHYGPHEGQFGPDTKDDGKTRLNTVVDAPGESFTYTYDLGSRWEHKIVVEEILPPNSDETHFPRCLAGERACPPEQCGGVPGYEELVRAIQRGVGWKGDVFDPETFDLPSINNRLRQLR